MVQVAILEQNQGFKVFSTACHRVTSSFKAIISLFFLKKTFD